MSPEAGARQLKLDLRKELDLDRSRFLNRLLLIGVTWGSRQHSNKRGSTFAETWDLAWRPEFHLDLVAAARHGSTIEQAASGVVFDKATQVGTVAELAAMIGAVLEADLPIAARRITQVIADRSALATDVFDLMDALPPLAELARYTSVRATDRDAVAAVVIGIVPRIAAGLGAGCQSLDDDAAAAAAQRISDCQQAMTLLDDPALTENWMWAIRSLATRAGLHGRVAGKATRILFDAGEIPAEEAGVRLQLALSQPGNAGAAAAWLEGFLASSGAVLIHGSALLPVIDGWLTGLDEAHFMEVLPVLRRTFSTFTKPERHDIGVRIKRGGDVAVAVQADEVGFSRERAAVVLPVLKLLLGRAA